MTAPFPLVEIALEGADASTRALVLEIMPPLVAKRPDLGLSLDEESGQAVLAGPSEEALEAFIDSLIKDRSLRLNVGAPHVAYREMITRATQVDAVHKLVRGGGGEFARVILLFEPGAPGSGVTFAQGPDCSLPEAYVTSVEQALRTIAVGGVLAGFPVIGLRATLIDGKHHDIDSTPLAFEIATRAAFRKLRDEAEPVLLQPLMKIEIETPKNAADVIARDLRTRQAASVGIEPTATGARVSGVAPLACLLGYAPTLAAMSAGRATYAMSYERHAVMPRIDDGPDLFPPAAAMRA